MEITMAAIVSLIVGIPTLVVLIWKFPREQRVTRLTEEKLALEIEKLKRENAKSPER